MSPNPLPANYFIIKLHKPAGKYSLKVTSSTGAVVFTTFVVSETDNRRWLALPASLAKGTSYLSAESGTGKDIVKLVILY